MTCILYNVCIIRNHAFTHWGRVTHICISNLTIISSDNGLSPGGCQDIIWTNSGILLIGPLGTDFNKALIEIHTFSFTKSHLKKMLYGKWRQFCLGLNVIMNSLNYLHVPMMFDSWNRRVIMVTRTEMSKAILVRSHGINSLAAGRCDSWFKISNTF